eukprot:COSAG02_NODE_61574_length_268_cov_0.615385_1_plen_38_part_10
MPPLKMKFVHCECHRCGIRSAIDGGGSEGHAGGVVEGQ